VAILTNSDSAPVPPELYARKLAAVAIGEPYPDRKAIRLAPELLQRYVGVYQIDAETKRFVTLENGQLYTQRTGSSRLPVLPASERLFFYESSFSELTFLLDEQGKVTGMSMQRGSGGPELATRADEALPTREAIAVDPAVLAGYVGRYELQPGFVLQITAEDGRRFAQATGQPKLELFASAETELFLKEVDARLSFVRGEDGRAGELVLHQGGRQMPAKRLP
jgi:D-alanyl-D-alanine carboxypeptidase